MKYWVYHEGEVPGVFEAAELAKLPTFTAATLVCPADAPAAERRWQRAGEHADIVEALQAYDRQPPPLPPPQARAFADPDAVKGPDDLLDASSHKIFRHVTELMKELENRREERAQPRRAEGGAAGRARARAVPAGPGLRDPGHRGARSARPQGDRAPRRRTADAGGAAGGRRAREGGPPAEAARGGPRRGGGAPRPGGRRARAQARRRRARSDERRPRVEGGEPRQVARRHTPPRARARPAPAAARKPSRRPAGYPRPQGVSGRRSW